MEFKIVMGEYQKPYVEIKGELDYKLSAVAAADVLRKPWEEITRWKIKP